MNSEEIKKLDNSIFYTFPTMPAGSRKLIIKLVLEAAKQECDKLEATTKFVTAKDYKLSLDLVEQLTSQLKALAVQNATLRAELDVYKKQNGSQGNGQFLKFVAGPQGPTGTVATTKLTPSVYERYNSKLQSKLEGTRDTDSITKTKSDGYSSYYDYGTDYNWEPTKTTNVNGYFPTYKSASEYYSEAKAKRENTANDAIAEANKAYNKLPPKRSSEAQQLIALINDLKTAVSQKTEALPLDDYNAT